MVIGFLFFLNVPTWAVWANTDTNINVCHRQAHVLCLSEHVLKQFGLVDARARFTWDLLWPPLTSSSMTQRHIWSSNMRRLGQRSVVLYICTPGSGQYATNLSGKQMTDFLQSNNVLFLHVSHIWRDGWIQLFAVFKNINIYNKWL